MSSKALLVACGHSEKQETPVMKAAQGRQASVSPLCIELELLGLLAALGEAPFA